MFDLICLEYKPNLNAEKWYVPNLDTNNWQKTVKKVFGINSDVL